MTLASDPTTSVNCPLCHAIAPPTTREALAGGLDWNCPRCHQNWTALRLSTVAAYSDYCVKRA